MLFGVLGPVVVHTDGGTPVHVPEAKVRTLLAVLLANRGRPVSAGRLAEHIWGDDPPDRPIPALHRKVWQLRRALEGAEPGARELVESRPPGYLLRPADRAIDACVFHDKVGRARETADPRARTRLLGEALTLWRGPAYADFAEDGFARAEIARLEEERLLALEDLAEARLEAGEHGQALGDLAELVARHPTRERLRAAHMRALYAMGRQSEALAGFHELRRHLREQLGVDPAPELVALHQEILEQRAGPPVRVAAGAAVPATNLPAPVTELIGRDDAVAAIGELVGKARLVTLTGSGGVGKTRLAVETARRLVGSYRDGVWMVELAGHRAAEAGAEFPPAEAVAAALNLRDDVAPAPVGRSALRRDGVERLVTALRGRQMLLLLDNCEHVVEQTAELVGEVLRGAPDVRVLATSREPLGHAGEVVWPVPPLDVPDAGAGAAPERVMTYAAARLFAQRAAAAVPGFTVDEGNAGDVATLCRRLDGVPLALELAATRVRAFGVRGVLARLDDRFRLLGWGRRGAPPRQRTLQAVIDWSWNLLDTAERALLSRLAVFGEGFTLEAAEAVCAGPDLPGEDVAGLVARLVDRSLVVAVHQESGNVRYRLLESVADYGLMRLREAGELADRRRLHALHYLELAEHAACRLRGPGQAHWARRLDEEATNLRLALDGAVRGGHAEVALRLADALAWHWFLRGRWGEALRSLGCVRAVADGAPPGLRARVAAWQSGVMVLSGIAGDPVAQCQDVLRRFETIDDPHGLARAQWFLGYALFGGGDQEASEDLVERALAGFRDRADTWGLAAALATRASQAIGRGDLAALGRHGEQSLAMFGELGDHWGRLYAMESLTVLAEVTGDYERARRLNEDSLGLAEELGLSVAVPGIISRMGRVAMLTGHHRQADELHRRARRAAVEQGDKPAELFADLGLALSARRQGRPEAAEHHLRPWIEWCRQVDWQPGLALICAELGFAAELRGDRQAAGRWHLKGLAAARRTGDPRAVALALEGLAGARALTGRHREAARLLGAAAGAREAAGAPLPPAERGDVDRVTATVRAAIGAAAFDEEFGRGRAEGADALPEVRPPGS